MRNFILFLVLLTSYRVRGQCRIQHINHEELSPKETKLSWTVHPECSDDNLQFEISVKLVNVKACHNGLNYDKKSSVFKTNRTEYLVSDLLPFSEYHIKIVPAVNAIGIDLSANISLTMPDGMPNVAPIASSRRPDSYVQALKFYWQNPEECEKQNGMADGFYVELWGADPWVWTPKKPIESHNVPKGISFFYFQSLLSFTHYKVKVFSKNSNGKWNPNVPLEMTAQTLPTDPEPPTNIKLTPSIRSVHLSWRPPYPPTGDVTLYKVRYGIPDEMEPEKDHKIVWKSSQNVPPTNLCISDNKSENNTLTHPICSVISDLEPNTTYVFELSTFHKDKIPSQSSLPLRIRTNLEPKIDNTTKNDPLESTRTPRANNSIMENGSGNPASGETNQALTIILIMLAVVVVLIIAITVFVYKIKVKKLRMRYEQQNSQVSMIIFIFIYCAYNPVLNIIYSTY